MGGDGRLASLEIKAAFPFYWRLLAQVLRRSVGRTPETSFVEPSRWRQSVCGGSGEVFFNKRYDALLRCCWILLLLLIPLVGHVGVESGWQPAMFCSVGGDGGIQVKTELSDPLPAWRRFYNIHCGGSSSIPSRELNVSQQPSGSSPVAKR
jgi:hypothetical protein